MRNQALYATAVLSALMAAPLAAKAAPVMDQVRPNAGPRIEVQYYGPGPYYGPGRDWQRCRWLRQRAREIEYRIGYAPPWDQPRLQQRLASVRQELWESCRR